MGMDYVPVLRRIPVRMDDIGQNYLIYKDSYSMYSEEPDDDWADGYAFYTKEHFTIIAADYDTKGISELFLIQLKEDPLRGAPAIIFEGLIVMNGDLKVPTACKVLFRRAPEELQELSWEEFVKKNELKLDLIEAADGTLRVKNARHPLEEIDGIPFGFYTSRLQFKGTGIELRL